MLPNLRVFCMGVASLGAAAVFAGQVQERSGSFGVVVAGHPEAAELGVSVLEGGGAAMDAAVAVSMALGVSEPYGSGLGGKLVYLYLPVGAEAPFAVDGLDRSPESWDADRYREAPRDERPYSWKAVAVPGTVAALAAGHSRWGRLSWRDVVEPVAELVERGAEVLPGNRHFMEAAAYRLSDPELKAWLLPNGGLPEVGSRLANADHARFLRKLARRGPDWFYGREMSRRAATASRGQFAPSDWEFEARVAPAMRAVLGTDGRSLWLPPPPTMGGVLVASYFRQWDGRPTRGSPELLDRFGRKYRRLDDEIRSLVGDVPGVRERVQAYLIGREPISARRPEPLSAEALGCPSTTHFVIVDAEGNALSATQSLSHHFGAGVSIPGTGIILNNSLTNFSYYTPDSPNAAAPAKRPRTTIAPLLIADSDSRPVALFGLPGGARIPSTTVQVLADWMSGQPFAAAVSAARWHPIRPRRSGDPAFLWDAEMGVGKTSPSALEALGWELGVQENPEAFGGITAALKNPDGSWTGYADLRRTNAARAVGNKN